MSGSSRATALLAGTTMSLFSSGAAAENLALRFDGGQTVRIPAASQYNGLDQATIEFWVQIDGPGGYIIDQFGPAPSNAGEWLINWTGELLQLYHRYGPIQRFQVGDGAGDGSWHHVAFVKGTCRRSISTGVV